MWTSRPLRTGRALEAGLFDCLGRRHGRRRAVGQRPAAVLLDPDGDRLVALPVQVGEHRRRRGERHFVLARAPAVQHADPQPFHRNRIQEAGAISLSDTWRAAHSAVPRHPYRRAARRGELVTPHGVVQTPAFMPVGTRGAVKAVTTRDLEDAGRRDHPRQHLSPVPAARRRPDRAGRRAAPVHRLGPPDPHRQRRLPGLQPAGDAADSRGGGEFRSHLDGSHLLTPERATEIQAQLGSDIAMVLDECIASPAGRRGAAAMERSSGGPGGRDALAGAGRAPGDVVVTNPGQAQFGIVQGGVFRTCGPRAPRPPWRSASRRYAIGGLSVGEPVEVMYDVVGHTAPLLPADRPRYLMGTGMPDDLVECVARGIDCSTACCRPATRATASSSRARGASSSRTRATPRTAAAGSGVRLLHLPPLLAGLPAAPVRGGRDDRGDPQHVA
jgi:queuine tRNA-ribosyltransferase